MTPRQALMQVRHIAAQTLDADGSLLFGEDGAIVAADFNDEQLGALPEYAVIFNIGDEVAHENEPRIARTLTIEALLFVRNYTDRYGGWSVLQVLEAERRLLADLGLVQKTGGLHVICRRKGTTRPVMRTERPLLYRPLRLELRNVGAINAADEYPPVSGLTLSDSGGTVTIGWTRPTGYDARYDWRGVTVRRKSGSAPASASDGDAVANDLDAASTTDTPGSGTWFYAAFAAYDSNKVGDPAYTSVTTDHSPAVSDSIAV